MENFERMLIRAEVNTKLMRMSALHDLLPCVSGMFPTVQVAKAMRTNILAELDGLRDDVMFRLRMVGDIK